MLTTSESFFFQTNRHTIVDQQFILFTFTELRHGVLESSKWRLMGWYREFGFRGQTLERIFEDLLKRVTGKIRTTDVEACITFVLFCLFYSICGYSTKGSN